MHGFRKRIGLGVAIAVAALPGSTAAQQRIWKDTIYPYGYYSSADGFWGVLHGALYSPIGFIERPEPTHAIVSLDLSASTAGSYLIVADAQAPAWWEGWRAGLTLTVGRANRLGYYGIGNTTTYSEDSITAAQPYFYRVSRYSIGARATVQRRLFGPVRALLGAGIEHTRFRSLPGATVFEQDMATGTVDSMPFDDGYVRAGLVVDTRDNEVDPHRGVLLEGLLSGGNGYSRTTVSARAYVSPVERLTIAARVGGESMARSPHVAAQMVMEGSERAFIAVGGFPSLRGYYDGRYTGRGKLLGGLEARYAILWAPTLFELKIVGFYETGRVFGPGEAFRVTSDGLHATGGGELGLRLLRNTVIVFGYGRGSEGGQFLAGSSWSF